jgi:hypothetical protein
MATTGELREIIEELQLVDVGDAANYLGEEVLAGGEYAVSTAFGATTGHDGICDCFVCRVQRV